MVIIEDTRNQVGKHKLINAYLTASGHQVMRSKLLVGDYAVANRGDIAIDTKQDVVELAMDVFRDHRRFRDECERAQQAGIRLIILIEEELPRDLDGHQRLDLWTSPKWRSTTAYHRRGDPITKADPQRLRKAIITMTKKYGVQFRFCDKARTGEMIIKFLTGGDP